MAEKRDYNNLNLWLPKQLERAEMSIERLSQLAKVSRATVYHWMNDRARPSEQVMVRVCRVLHVPFEQGLAQYVPKQTGRPRTRKPQERNKQWRTHVR